VSWPGSICIASAAGPLTQADLMADVILTQMTKTGLRSGKGTHDDPVRPTWKEMSSWCQTALDATKPAATYANTGSATPTTPEREWACNRCVYSWDGPAWCPSCGNGATHGRAFAVPILPATRYPLPATSDATEARPS
jgi:hypothetical protein